MSEPEDPHLSLLLRFSRRLALERSTEKVREAVVQSALEVVSGDGAALVARGVDGTLAVVAQFGVDLDSARAELQRCVSDAISARQTTLVHTDPTRAGRPDRGRLAAAPCQVGGQRGALVVGRLGTAAELRREDLVPLRMVATIAEEALRRTHAEERAAALELHLEAWAATSAEGVLLLDSDRRVVRVNPAAATALGARVEGLVGRAVGELEGVGALTRLLDAPAAAQDAVVTALPGGAYRARSRRHRLGEVVLLQREQAVKRASGHRARYRFEDLLTQDAGVLRAIDAARQTAQSGVSILITGESGTGKEVLAQAIHAASPRASEPFVAVNVAAIPAELLESELFGYEAGAFTGAVAQGKPGSFEVAGRGTLLLDEIGEMPPSLQSKLLRVLQELQVQRLGGTVPIPVQARVLATTNRDLRREVVDGRFRLDLYHRLKVVSIAMPPLRERPGDIPLLAEHFLRQATEQLGRGRLELGPAVLDQLLHHGWPGNIRELSNLLLGVVSLLPPTARVLEELPVFLSRPELTPIAAPIRDSLPPERLAGPPRPTPPAAGAAPNRLRDDATPARSLAESEREAVARALAATGRNMSRTARILGISRTTLYKKLKDHGLEGP